MAHAVVSPNASRSLEDLWGSVSSGADAFEPSRLVTLPLGAVRYLRHAIAAGTPLACAVRLTMHGEIKLKGWHPFTADEVIAWGRGFTWQARVRGGWMSITGGDSFLDGAGAMHWKIFDLLPIVNASGPDITRAAAGRLNIESVWLPSALCGTRVAWAGSDDSRVSANFLAHGEPADISYVIDADGRLQSVAMPRWGNPGNEPFHYVPFGGVVEAEQSFSGYTIPARMRIGWYFGTDRFDSAGEFFRVTIDNAEFR